MDKSDIKKVRELCKLIRQVRAIWLHNQGQEGYSKLANGVVDAYWVAMESGTLDRVPRDLKARVQRRYNKWYIDDLWRTTAQEVSPWATYEPLPDGSLKATIVLGSVAEHMVFNSLEALERYMHLLAA